VLQTVQTPFGFRKYWKRFVRQSVKKRLPKNKNIHFCYFGSFVTLLLYLGKYKHFW
jgi:hypothetical protein